MNRISLSISGFLFCSILGGLVGLAYLLLDPIIKHVVLTKLVLRDNSDFADLWSTPPVTPHIKVSAPSMFFKKHHYGGQPATMGIGPFFAKNIAESKVQGVSYKLHWIGVIYNRFALSPRRQIR